MSSILEKIPVEQQAKPVVGIPADRARVFPTRAIGGLRRRTINLNVNPTRFARPT